MLWTIFPIMINQEVKEDDAISSSSLTLWLLTSIGTKHVDFPGLKSIQIGRPRLTRFF